MWLVLVFSFLFSCILLSFFQSASFTFNSFALRSIYDSAGFTIDDTRIDCFFFFKIIDAWVFTYWVSFLASGFTALRYCFLIVGCETSFLDCLAMGDVYLYKFFFVVDFLLPEPIVFCSLASDLYFFIVGLMKY